MEWFLNYRPDLANARLALGRAGSRQAPPAVAAARPSHEEAAACACSIETSSCPTTACARSPRSTSAIPTCSASTARDLRVQLPAGRVRTRGLFGGNSNWRGPIWFPVNYPDHRVAAEVSSLLRRRLQGRVPDRLGPLPDDQRSRRRDRRAPDAHLPARTSTGTRPVFAQYPRAAARSALPRLPAVLRILPRRHRPRRRRLASDRLDRPRREAAAAARARSTAMIDAGRRGSTQRRTTLHTFYGHDRHEPMHASSQSPPGARHADGPAAEAAAGTEGARHRRELRHRPWHRACARRGRRRRRRQLRLRRRQGARSLPRDREARRRARSRSAPTCRTRRRCRRCSRARSIEFGTLDILVNNAGLQQDAPFEQMTLEAVEQGDRRQSHRPVPVLARSGAGVQTSRRARRRLVRRGQDHLHQLRPRSDSLGGPRELRSVEGRRDAHDEEHRAGSRAVSHPREQHLPGRHPHTDQHGSLGHAGGVRTSC